MALTSNKQKYIALVDETIQSIYSNNLKSAIMQNLTLQSLNLAATRLEGILHGQVNKQIQLLRCL